MNKNVCFSIAFIFLNFVIIVDKAVSVNNKKKCEYLKVEHFLSWVPLQTKTGIMEKQLAI